MSYFGQVTVGTPASQAEVCPLMWRLGSCYLYEEVLPAAAIFFMYVMGRAYRGLFQDVDMTRFIPQEACGGGNLAILESLETEQQSTTAAQKGEGSLRAGVGGVKAEGGGIVWDMEKLLGFLAQLSGRKLIFAFDGSYGDVPVSTGATTVVNLVDPISAAASPTGGMLSLEYTALATLCLWFLLFLNVNVLCKNILFPRGSNRHPRGC